jgi:malonyl-CoA O-methyltransferase
MSGIVKDIVRKAFSTRADYYDSLAVVQKRVTDRFVELLAEDMASPKAILDIGAGTGRLLESLNKKFPDAALVGVDLAFGMTSYAKKRFQESATVSLACGDAERLPFREESFDLVVSTSTYQWIDPLETAFAEAFRVLRPGSRFSFALFGEKTLFELRESYKTAVSKSCRELPDRTHSFVSQKDVLDLLNAAGFNSVTVESEIEVELHSEVKDLVRSLKGIGAGSASGAALGGLSGRSVIEGMIQAYKERFSVSGGVPATYEVIYGTARKPGF